MIYRRSPFKLRRPSQKNTNPNTEIIKNEILKELPKIPLPNEEEPEENLEEARLHSSKFINIFNQKIFLDEIILFGLLFILFEEKIEDEFLLIILVYILIAGRV